MAALALQLLFRQWNLYAVNDCIDQKHVE